MELAKLEVMRNQAVQRVIMQEKMVEQAKADVAQIEGRIAERKEILAEAKPVKKKGKPKPTKGIAKMVEQRLGKRPRKKK